MLAIIIPCYNEANRLLEEEILLLSKYKNSSIFLVNDGSKDNTLDVINTFSKKYNNVSVINYDKNEGKATTIFKAIQHLKKSKEYLYIGYLDADFATRAKEYITMFEHLKERKKEYIFGSRISTLSSHIERNTLRHYIGRIVVTILNFRYKLGVYDTQCGAKIFSIDSIKQVTQVPFFTNWLFDIELFLRLREKSLMSSGIEFPLNSWKDVSGSKLSLKEFIKIILDFYKLYKNY